jgi:preprotein translocase subunit SecD
MRRRYVFSLVGIVAVTFALLGLTVGFGYAPKLGLDLQGGASVTLLPKGEVQQDALGQAVQIIRNRVDALGVAEPEITRQGNAIVVNLPGVKDQDRALQLVGQTAELRFRPVLQVLSPAEGTAVPTTTAPAAGPTSPTTAAPADTTATTAPADTTVPSDTTPTTAAAGGGPGGAVPLPRQESPTTTAPAATTPTTAAPAETTTVAPTSTTAGFATTKPEDDKVDQEVVLPEKDASGNVVRRYLLGPAFLTGSAVSGADAVFNQSANEWQVNLDMKGGSNGIDTWNRVTQLCFNGDATCPGIGSRGKGLVAITLDGVVQSAPEIQPDNSTFSPFQADQISISGNFGENEAKNLGLVLRYGALPVQLEPQAVQTVSATLGKDSLKAGVIAGIVGVLLVVAFMFLYYRSLGWIVLGGLLISTGILWSVISYLGESRGLALTLAGATGIIVSIGVTVDSYVVYFERLKDDARLGRTFRSAAQRGWASAWRTILAADIVSLIGAALLWYLTVGSVRGFAFFLGLSTLIDLIVAYFFLRPAVILLSQSHRYRGKTHLFGVTQGEAAGAVASAPAGGGGGGGS